MPPAPAPTSFCGLVALAFLVSILALQIAGSAGRYPVQAIVARPAESIPAVTSPTSPVPIDQIVCGADQAEPGELRVTA